MRAVWTFWSKPFMRLAPPGSLLFRGTLASCIISLENAKKHFRQTVLHADRAAINLLVRKLGLDFSKVDESLNDLSGWDPGWWTTGKFVTYSLQKEPFLHLDYDVFLWRPIPTDLLAANLFAQNTEPFLPGHSETYQLEQLEDKLPHRGALWLPEEWFWFKQSVAAADCYAVNCGIFGGHNVEFIHNYATTALGIIKKLSFGNIPFSYQEKWLHTISVEQYLLAALAAHGVLVKNHEKCRITYLIDVGSDFSEQTKRLGYTHLIGKAKSDPRVIQKLEERIALDYPGLFDKYLMINRDTSPWW